MTTLRTLACFAIMASGVTARAQVTPRDAAAIPPALAREVSARAAERGLPPDEALAPVADAAERGVPPELVAAKVLEGLAKGVPPARVVAVARDLSERLARADAVLAEARRAKLAPPADRRAALLDLASATAAGVDRPQLDALIEAARAARGGNTDSVVSAAHAVGELARRGVPPAEAMPLGAAIARRGVRAPGEIPALFDAWREEGGRDARTFVGEAARRVDGGRKLDGMVDAFGESPDRVNVDRHRRGPDRDGVAGSDGKHGADEGIPPGQSRTDTGRPVPGLGNQGAQGPSGGTGPKK
jgi:hypothetical protein